MQIDCFNKIIFHEFIKVCIKINISKASFKNIYKEFSLINNNKVKTKIELFITIPSFVTEIED